jgi:hypothetical protein
MVKAPRISPRDEMMGSLQHERTPARRASPRYAYQYGCVNTSSTIMRMPVQTAVAAAPLPLPTSTPCKAST